MLRFEVSSMEDKKEEEEEKEDDSKGLEIPVTFGHEDQSTLISVGRDCVIWRFCESGPCVLEKLVTN